MQISTSLSTLARRLSVVCFGLFSVSFLVLPTATGQSLLRRLAPGAPQLTLALSVFFAAAAVVLLLLSKVVDFEPNQAEASAGARRPFRHLPVLVIFQLSASLLILGLCWSNVRLPLEWDENSIASLFPAASFLEVVNPFRAPEQHTQNTNQSIATLLSYLSYKTFGMSKLALRLPSLTLLVLVLGILFYLSRSLAPLTTVLLYLHLCTNQLFLWYAQVAKGYISMVAGATGLLLFLFSPPAIRYPKVVFGLLLLVTLFSHPFGALFVVVLFLSLLTWLSVVQAEMSREKHHYYRELLLLCLAVLPLVALVCGFQFYSMRERAEVSLSGPISYLEVWSGIFGANKVWWAKIVALCAAALITMGLVDTRKLPRDFLSYFIATGFFFFLGVSLTLGVAAPFPRVMLAFLIPFLIWLAEASVRVKRPTARYALLGTLFLVVVVAPLTHARQVRASIYANYLPFENFISQAKQITAGTPRHCLSFHGIGAERQFAEKVHFPREARTEGELCRQSFHLLLAAEHDVQDHTSDFFLKGITLAELDPLFSDRHGRAVFKLREGTPAVSANFP